MYTATIIVREMKIRDFLRLLGITNPREIFVLNSRNPKNKIELCLDDTIEDQEKFLYVDGQRIDIELHRYLFAGSKIIQRYIKYSCFDSCSESLEYQTALSTYDARHNLP
jgi:hypothetical protein